MPQGGRAAWKACRKHAAQWLDRPPSPPTGPQGVADACGIRMRLMPQTARLRCGAACGSRRTLAPVGVPAPGALRCPPACPAPTALRPPARGGAQPSSLGTTSSPAGAGGLESAQVYPTSPACRRGGRHPSRIRNSYIPGTDLSVYRTTSTRYSYVHSSPSPYRYIFPPWAQQYTYWASPTFVGAPVRYAGAPRPRAAPGHWTAQSYGE